MNSYTQILSEYQHSFNDLITSRNLKSNKAVKDVIRLNNNKEWSFMCTALDILNDTTLAIDNFLEHGLEGHSDGNDPDEMYLRLYGILNACYLQQFAIYNLYKICNLEKLDKTLKELNDLKIYELRNKLGAHSIDYKNKDDELECYVINRSSLSGYLFEYSNNNNSEREWVNLKECLVEHLVLIIDYLDKVYEKYINTLYKGKNSKPKDHINKLAELRMLQIV
jgi:hypothetical protein